MNVGGKSPLGRWTVGGEMGRDSHRGRVCGRVGGWSGRWMKGEKKNSTDKEIGESGIKERRNETAGW